MISNKKYIFILIIKYIYLVCSPFLAQSSYNPWNFLSSESDEGVFCYVIEVTGSTQGWGLAARKTNHVIRGLEISAPSSPDSGKGRGAGG